MKRLIPLAVAVIVACSCSALTHQRYMSTLFLDFRPYTESGFFISPDAYTGQFSPLGEISISIRPSVQKPAKQIRGAGNYQDGLYAMSNGVPVIVEEIPAEELLEIAVNEAKARGANGIANFKCARVPDADPTEKYHYEISGFAIKILDR